MAATMDDVKAFQRWLESELQGANKQSPLDQLREMCAGARVSDGGRLRMRVDGSIGLVRVLHHKVDIATCSLQALNGPSREVAADTLEGIREDSELAVKAWGLTITWPRTVKARHEVWVKQNNTGASGWWLAKVPDSSIYGSSELIPRPTDISTCPFGDRDVAVKHAMGRDWGASVSAVVLRETGYAPAGTLTLYTDGTHEVKWWDECEHEWGQESSCKSCGMGYRRRIEQADRELRDSRVPQPDDVVRMEIWGADHPTHPQVVCTKTKLGRLITKGNMREVARWLVKDIDRVVQSGETEFPGREPRLNTAFIHLANATLRKGHEPVIEWVGESDRIEPKTLRGKLARDLRDRGLDDCVPDGWDETAVPLKPNGGHILVPEPSQACRKLLGSPPTACTSCAQPFNAYRKEVPDSKKPGLCADCYLNWGGNGSVMRPLDKRIEESKAKREPKRGVAWSSPGYGDDPMGGV